jgi:hypothetical protein
MMPDSPHFHINAVAFKEGNAWIVQGIEYDIVAHAYEVAALPTAFVRAVLDNIAITRHLGRRALEGIMPAPAHFRVLYERAQTEIPPPKTIDPRAPSITVKLVA